MAKTGKTTVDWKVQGHIYLPTKEWMSQKPVDLLVAPLANLDIVLSMCEHPPFSGSYSGHTLKSIGCNTPAIAHPFWATANVHETTWVEPNQYVQGQGGGATYNS